MEASHGEARQVKLTIFNQVLIQTDVPGSFTEQILQLLLPAAVCRIQCKLRPSNVTTLYGRQTRFRIFS